MILLYCCPNDESDRVKNQRGLQGAKRLFLVEITLVATIAMTLAITKNSLEGMSIMAGGLVWAIPQGIFAIVVFADQRAQFVKKMVRRMYRGEALKLLITAGCMALAFRFGQISPSMFFIGYVLAFGVSWFAPLFFRRAVNRYDIKH